MKSLPKSWSLLRKQAEADGYLLSEPVFEQVREIFLGLSVDGGLSPENLTREFLNDEFLLVLDEEGSVAGISRKVLDSFRETAALSPEFTKWFRAARSPAILKGESVLLAARWLCHLIGLRHGTVEIFIDPPHLDGHTLVQVRGLEKFEAPGAFDIPCAGHISGIDSVERSLEKELAEELNLFLDDFDEFRLLKRYNSYTRSEVGAAANYEHRVLYRARLKPAAAGRIRFQDGEVAGMALFSLPELREMVSRYPERIASGLSDAMDYYQ